MKRMRILTKAVCASGRFRVIAAVAILCAITLAAALEAQDNLAGDLFYTTASSASSFTSPNAEVFAIQVRGTQVTTRDIGSTQGGACISLALSPSRTLYSMCGDLTLSTGIQNLAIIEQKTGRANLFGVDVIGFSVMALAFGPNGNGRPLLNTEQGYVHASPSGGRSSRLLAT